MRDQVYHLRRCRPAMPLGISGSSIWTGQDRSALMTLSETRALLRTASTEARLSQPIPHLAAMPVAGERF